MISVFGIENAASLVDVFLDKHAIVKLPPCLRQAGKAGHPADLPVNQLTEPQLCKGGKRCVH